jgi:fumarate hydratase class II
LYALLCRLLRITTDVYTLAFTKDGSKVEAEPTNEMLSITGMGVARLTPELRIASIEIYSDPAELFRQMTKNGVTKVADATPEELAQETRGASACPMGFGKA